jgi:geranylgeranyl pyrophosphate synthase
VLEAVQGPDGDRIRALLDRPRPYPDEAVEEVIRLVREGGYVDRTLEAAMQRVRVATDALGVLPASPTREILATLGEYLVARVDAARAY